MFAEKVVKPTHLPGLDSDTVHGIMHVDVLHCDVGDTCLGIVPSKSSDADPVSGPTIYVVNVDIGATCLD